MTLEEHSFHDFTECKKVSFMINGIMTNALQAPIAAINMNTALRENFELPHLQLAESIRMANECSYHTYLNESITYTGFDDR